MSSMESLSSSILQNTVNASQQEINTLLKQLQTGLKINSSADDPANLYVSDKLNLKALEDASTASNAQSGLTYLQVAQKAYSDIVTQLNKINDLANLALKGGYTDSQLSDFQDKITESINAIKLIETGTMFNGIQVFDNQNSVGLVNEHLFAITSKTDVTITTATLIDNRGKDFSAYLSNPTIHRYEKQDVGGTITLKNDLGATLTPDANLVTIETAAQLVSALSSTVTAGRTFILLDNIDLSSLGTKTAALIAGTFLGTLEGNGYEISGLQINSTTADNVGLFERLGAGSVVQNVILKDFSVKGDQEVGALAGGDGGATISNVAVLDANVQGNFEVGGLVGFAGGGTLIQNTYATGNVYGDSVSTSLGGLVGRNGSMAHVYNCFSNVDVTGGNKVGGIVGDNILGGVVSESYSRGDVIGKTNVGGLVGNNAVGASVNNTYSLGTVTGQTNAAGLVGNNLGTVTNSYSLSAVKDSTTTYDIANFQVAATSEVVAGEAQRPNDAFSITFDYAGKTYAFDTIDNFNKFKNFTLGTPSGEVDLLYEKDAVTNTWYGRKLQATNQYTYTSSALPDASVNGVPEDDNGVSFSVIATIAAGGHAAAGTYAFKNEADKNSFLTFNTTNTTTTNIDKFYKLDAPNNKWDSQALTVNASTYAVSAGAGTSFVNTPLSSYGLFNDLWTDTAGARGVANTVYAFANENDKNAFANANGDVGLFYKANADNTWSALKQSVGAAGSYSYTSSNIVGSTAVDDPQDDLNHYVYISADGSAFSSVDDLNNYNDGVTFLGEISKYYVKTAADTWTAKKITKTVTSTYTQATSGTSVASAPIDADGVLYGLVKTIGGAYAGTYAFSSQTDYNNFGNGTPTGTIGRYYLKTGDGVTANWQEYTVTKTPGQTTYAISPPIAGGALDASPLDPDGVNFNIVKHIATGVAAGDYRFATQADLEHFNDGITFTGAVSKFYKFDTGNDKWAAEEIKPDPAAAITPVAVGGSSGTAGTVPVDDKGLIYSYQKVVNGVNYAFSSVTDMNNFIDTAHFRALIGRFYEDRADGSTNPWWGYSTTFATSATITNTGTVAISKPASTDGLNYNIFATGSDGNQYAFSSQVDADNWNDGNYRDSISKYYVHFSVDPATVWTGYSIIKHDSYVTYDYSVGGLSDPISHQPVKLDAMPHDSDGIAYTIEKHIATGGAADGDYRFSSQADADNFNDGVIFTGTISKFYKYNGNALDTWELMSLTPVAKVTALAGTVTSGPTDADGVAYTYTKLVKENGGTGTLRKYAFASVTDMNNFVNDQTFNGSIGRFYVDMADGSTSPWKSCSVNSALVLYTGGWAVNKPDSATFSLTYNGTPDGWLDTTLASGAGFYYFQTDSDRNAFQLYIAGGQDAINVDYYFMASPDGENATNYRSWVKRNISYGEKTGSIKENDLGISVTSQPLDPTYSYYSSDFHAWFSSKAEADIVWKWQNAGTRTGLDNTGITFNDIYWYQHVGYDQGTDPWSWHAYKLWDTIHAATYQGFGQGSAASKPNDNSFDVAGTNPNNSTDILYFNSTSDRDTYIQYLTDKKNGIAPSKTFDINYYQYNSGTNKWDQKEAKESVTKSNLMWIYVRPDDVNYNFTNTATNGWYGTSGKANGDGLYYFQSDSDKKAFEDYLAGSIDTFNVTYLFLASELSSWFSTSSTINPRTWTKYTLQKANPLVQNALAVDEVGSKPKSATYNVYDPVYRAWFATEGEKQTFLSYQEGTLTGTGVNFSDIYFYRNNAGAGVSSIFDEYKLSATVIPDKYNKVGVDINPVDSITDTVNSRPNDSNYANNLSYHSTGSTAGAAYDGDFYFSSINDETIFNNVRMGLQSGNIPNIYYYKYNTSNKNWDREQLTSVSNTTYNNVLYGGGTHTGSPSLLGYEKVWNDIPHSNEYAFNSSLDMSNFQAYIAGTLNANVDILYYQRTGANSWQEKRLTSSLGSASYAVTARPADNTIGRPEKDGYDILSADGKKAFANAVDLATYNGGTPTGAIDLFYQYNAVSKQWDAYGSTKNTDTYAQTTTATIVDGMPDEEDYGTIAKIGGTFYAFKDETDKTNFAAALAQGWGVANATKIAGIDRYYEYTPGTNKWQAKKVGETTTQTYGIVAKATPNIAGLAERPTVSGYDYLTTIAAGGNAGTYAFKSADDRTSFLNYNAGNGTVNPITNYYKLNVTNKLADLVSGKLIDSWDGQKLEYDNNTGYLIGKNTGTITDSFYGNGEASANYVYDGVTILGNTQIAADALPISGWSAAIWDTTSTSKPILKNTKAEGSEDIKEANLTKLLDETKYVYHIYDSYATNDIRLNTAVTSGSFTAVVPASAPVGVDAAGRPLVATVNLTGLAGKYASNITVSDNANSSIKYSEGKDFVVYTNDNGASWKMDILSSAMYSKTIKVDYTAASTASVDQAVSGFNVYLGDNKSLMVKDMTLDLAGRLNFNVTRSGEVNGAIDAMKEVLEYMKHKQAEVSGEITVATNALNNKTSQNKTKTNAISNILSVDEAKAKAELAKQQLLQSKTDQILQKFYDLQTSTMQALLSSSFNSSASGYGGIYQGLTGVNNLYNKNIVDYNYKNLYGTSSSN